MKTKFLCSLAACAMLLTSCKSDPQKNESEPQAPTMPEVSNTFNVTVDLLIQKDDELILFYKDRTISYFEGKNTVYLGVKGMTQPQKLTFSVPEGILPNDIRFDISSNKQQAPIKINSISLSYQDRTFTIGAQDIEKYFTPNEGISFDARSATATFSEKNGNYDPYFNTKPAIYAELEKVIGQPL